MAEILNITAEQVIAALELQPHPEGGHYRESYRHQAADGARGAMTAIYYLLRAAEISAWHRVNDADEIWHHYAGAALELSRYQTGATVERLLLGPDLLAGQRPQAVIMAGQWQSARSLGDWSLMGCTVGPAFQFESFEMAPKGWLPE
ncbi:MAG: cupin domain-containing protein [Alphaproteobacteria bacterium]|nr:cupin domain-containing protein [Alphaproteobacteria bacterium]